MASSNTPGRGHVLESLDQPVRLRDLAGIIGYSFLTISFLARLPMSMTIVGVITFISVERGSIAEAGLAAAVTGICAGAGGLLLGTLVDRFGQRSALLVVALVHPSALLLLVLLGQGRVSMATVLVLCMVVGLTSPHVGPLTRMRWITLLDSTGRRGARQVNTVLSYEGTMDEIAFVAGPAVAGALALAFGPGAPLLGAAGITIVFVLSFALHRTGRRERNAAYAVPQGRTRWSGWLAFPVIGMLFVGAFFGSSLAALTAFLGANLMSETTGLFYSLLGLSSAIASLLMAVMPVRISLPARLVVSCAMLVAVAVFLPSLSSVWSVAVAYFLLGVGIGPTMVTLFGLAASVIETTQVGRAMTLLGSATIVGQSLLSAITGQAAQEFGFSSAMILIICSAAGLLILALARCIAGHVTAGSSVAVAADMGGTRK